jgi:hypothetical protein
MKPISYARHRFPPDIIRHAVWLYLRFTLSYRDVEDLLAERGLTVSNESIRWWVLKFGPLIASNLRTIRPKAYTHRSQSLDGKCTCGVLSTAVQHIDSFELRRINPGRRQRLLQHKLRSLGLRFLPPAR